MSILGKYSFLEFSGKNNDRVFDYNHVDYKTTVEIEEFISSPIQLPRNSASESIVFRGKWKQKWIYAQTFKKDNQALLYDKEIYRYIKTQISKNPYQDAYIQHLSSRYLRANMVRLIALSMSQRIPVESLSRS